MISAHNSVGHVSVLWTSAQWRTHFCQGRQCNSLYWRTGTPRRSVGPASGSVSCAVWFVAEFVYNERPLRFDAPLNRWTMWKIFIRFRIINTWSLEATPAPYRPSGFYVTKINCIVVFVHHRRYVILAIDTASLKRIASTFPTSRLVVRWILLHLYNALLAALKLS